MSKLSYRYVELSVVPPEGKTIFAGVLVEAASPNLALEEAIADTRRRYPTAEINEFLQRIITPVRAKEIETAITHGTWEGWPLTK